MQGSRGEGLARRVWPVLVVTTLSLLAARPVRADAANARAHYEKGRSYFQVGEYRKALEEFKTAHIEKNDVAYIYNIAECHRQLGEPKEALDFYRRFIRLAPANQPARLDAERHIAELESAPAAAPPPSGGGQAAGRPAPPSSSSPANAAPSRPAGAEPAIAPAVSASTPPPAPVNPGAVAAPAAQPSSAPADSGPREQGGHSGSRRTIAYVIGGTGLAALAVGGYFGIRARSKWNESESHCPQNVCDDTGKSLSDDARTSARLADVAVGAGLVGVGVAAYLYFSSTPSPSSVPSSQARAQRIRIEPYAGPNRLVGVVMGGAW